MVFKSSALHKQQKNNSGGSAKSQNRVTKNKSLLTKIKDKKKNKKCGKIKLMKYNKKYT